MLTTGRSRTGDLENSPVANVPARSVRDAVCEAMGSAVPEGFRTQAPSLSPVAAGTDEPERVAVQGVAADAAVFDTDAATSYGDGVQHRLHLDRPTVASQGAAQHSERDGAAVEHSYLKCGECGRVTAVPSGTGLPDECPYCHTWHVGWSMVAEHHPCHVGWRDDRGEVRFYWHPKGEANAEREAVRRARLSRWQEQR